MNHADPCNIKKAKVEVATTTLIPVKGVSSTCLPAKGSIIQLVVIFCLSVAVSVGIGVALHPSPTETNETEKCSGTTTVEKRKRYALNMLNNRYAA